MFPVRLSLLENDFSGVTDDESEAATVPDIAKHKAITKVSLFKSDPEIDCKKRQLSARL